MSKVKFWTWVARILGIRTSLRVKEEALESRMAKLQRDYGVDIDRLRRLLEARSRVSPLSVDDLWYVAHGYILRDVTRGIHPDFSLTRLATWWGIQEDENMV